MEALNKIDWELLRKQRETLTEVIFFLQGTKHSENLEGIQNLLDALQDENDEVNKCHPTN